VFFQRPRQSEQQGVAAIDAQGAIELMEKFDGFSAVAAVAGKRRQRDRPRAQSDRVIFGYDALVMQGQTAVEVEAARQAAEVAGGLGGGTGEAAVVVGAEVFQHDVGLVQSGGLREAKFADQAVLAGAPGALDAALGLGRVGGDLLNAELLENASQLGGGLFSGELFGQGPVLVVALKDGVAVAVEAERHAVGGNQGEQGAEIADGIFAFQLEVSGEDLAGGIVLKADEGKFGSTALEPIVAAGIGERHHAETRAGGGGGDIYAAAASAEKPLWQPVECGARPRDRR
jgi:hypothetical protein